MTVADLSRLRQKAGLAAIDLGAFDKLKMAIGNDFQRTARLHPMPEGSMVLPAIATFLGPRVVADAAAFRPLVNSEVDGRYMIGSGDVAYVLGLDRGKTYLAADLRSIRRSGRSSMWRVGSSHRLRMREISMAHGSVRCGARQRRWRAWAWCRRS